MNIALVNGQLFHILHENAEGLFLIRRPKGNKSYVARRCDPTMDQIYGANRYYIVQETFTQGGLPMKTRKETHAICSGCGEGNSHEELLQALKRVTDQYEAFLEQTGESKQGFHIRLMRVAKQAISKAEAL